MPCIDLKTRRLGNAHCPIPQTKLFFSAGTFTHYFRGWIFQDPETKVIYSIKELPRYLREDVVYEAETL